VGSEQQIARCIQRQAIAARVREGPALHGCPSAVAIDPRAIVSGDLGEEQRAARPDHSFPVERTAAADRRQVLDARARGQRAAEGTRWAGLCAHARDAGARAAAVARAAAAIAGSSGGAASLPARSATRRRRCAGSCTAASERLLKARRDVRVSAATGGSEPASEQQAAGPSCRAPPNPAGARRFEAHDRAHSLVYHSPRA